MIFIVEDLKNKKIEEIDAENKYDSLVKYQKQYKIKNINQLESYRKESGGFNIAITF